MTNIDGISNPLPISTFDEVIDSADFRLGVESYENNRHGIFLFDESGQIAESYFQLANDTAIFGITETFVREDHRNNGLSTWLFLARYSLAKQINPNIAKVLIESGDEIRIENIKYWLRNKLGFNEIDLCNKVELSPDTRSASKNNVEHRYFVALYTNALKHLDELAEVAVPAGITRNVTR